MTATRGAADDSRNNAFLSFMVDPLNYCTAWGLFWRIISSRKVGGPWSNFDFIPADVWKLTLSTAFLGPCKGYILLFFFNFENWHQHHRNIRIQWPLTHQVRKFDNFFRRSRVKRITISIQYQAKCKVRSGANWTK
jgi:hypothetical protein